MADKPHWNDAARMLRRAARLVNDAHRWPLARLARPGRGLRSSTRAR